MFRKILLRKQFLKDIFVEIYIFILPELPETNHCIIHRMKLPLPGISYKAISA